MIKTNPKIKQKLTDKEMIGFSKDLSSAYFSKDESGERTYTPYMTRITFKLLFYLYCVEGLAFDADENGQLEAVLPAVEADQELWDIYESYSNGCHDSLEISHQLQVVWEQARETADFQKEFILQKQSNGVNCLLKVFEELFKTTDLTLPDWGTILSSLSNISQEKDKGR